MQRTLYLMVKEPRPGQVKTRLGRDIGMVEAAWWFRHQTRRMIVRLDDPRWRLVLAVSPDQAGMTSRVWPGSLARIAQGQGSLGDRMARLLRTAPPGPACIVGADIPGLTAAHISRAFEALGQNDAVFGPAKDGGYWLVGLKRTRSVPGQIFSGVRWSGPMALQDSIASIPSCRIALTDTLSDVDHKADLTRLRLSPQTQVAFGDDAPAGSC